MFQMLITGDLPSTERPGAAPGDDAYARTHDRVAHGSAHLLDALRRVFHEVGVRDLAWVKVDDELVYQDTTGTTTDEIDDLLRRAAHDGYLGRPFFRLELGLCHEEEGLRHVLVAAVSTSVPAGEPELQVEVGSMPVELFAKPGEAAHAYAARLNALAAKDGAWTGWTEHLHGLRDRLERSLGAVMSDATIASSPANFVVVRPGRPELGAMEGLRFGGGVVQPRYELAPEGRWPHWPGVFGKVWDDPYAVFRSVVWLDALMQLGFLRREDVLVVEPDGRVLFDGRRAGLFASWPWRKRFDVRHGDDRLEIRFA